MDAITLREVCQQVGVSRRVIQGYEKMNMVRATGKNKYGYLLYDQEAVNQIREIKMYRDMGFSMRETRELMNVSDEIRRNMLAYRIENMYQELKFLKENIELAKRIIE